MLAVPAIAGLTVDRRFVEPKGAVFAMAVDHHANARIRMYDTSVDAETACSPGCRFCRAAAVVVDVVEPPHLAIRSGSRAPPPVFVAGLARPLLRGDQHHAALLACLVAALAVDVIVLVPVQLAVAYVCRDLRLFAAGQPCVLLNLTAAICKRQASYK
jgi:hypothetical protein